MTSEHSKTILFIVYIFEFTPDITKDVLSSQKGDKCQPEQSRLAFSCVSGNR